MERSRDWWVQAEADLRHARRSLEMGDYEWACFAAQQAAEKAVKAVFERRGVESWGHSLLRLLQAIRETGTEVPEEVLDTARVLDKHYIPTRYPNALAEGAPTELYTRKEAENAIGCAEAVLRFCHPLLGGP